MPIAYSVMGTQSTWSNSIITNWKANPSDIARAHRRTYVDARTGNPQLQDYLLMEGVPALVVALSLVLGATLPHKPSDALIVVTGALSGILLAAMIGIALRAMHWTERSPMRGKSTSEQALYLGELTANIGYASLAAIVACVVFIVASISDGWLLRLASAFGIGLGIHFVFVFFMVAKRVFALAQSQLNLARTRGNPS